MAHFLKRSALLVSFFAFVQLSTGEAFGEVRVWKESAKSTKQSEKEEYKEYFQQQEQIHKELLILKIPGVCSLRVDQDFAEEILTNCPQEVNDLVSKIEQKRFDKTMYFLQGVLGTGKTALAQAIAVKTQTPCLFFDARAIVAESMRSNVQYLEMIFEYAAKFKEKPGQSCIMIFDQLETLTKIDADKKDQEHSAFIDFLKNLDYLNNRRLGNLQDKGFVLIGVTDEARRLPDQITGKARMIEVSLPNQEQRKSIFAYYLKDLENKHGIVHSCGVSPVTLARNTKGYSRGDAKNLIERAADPLIIGRDLPNGSDKLLTHQSCFRLIRQAKKQSRLKFVDNLYKTYFRMPKNPLAFGAIMLGCMTLSNQNRQTVQAKEIAERQMELAERGLIQSKEIAEAQRKQAMMIAAAQMMVQLLTFGLFHFPKG